MANIRVLAAGESQGFQARPNIKPITPVVQTSTGVTYNLELFEADESGAIDISSATITGTMLNRDTGDTPTSIAGTLAVVSGSSGTFNWSPTSADLGTAGAFEVQFKFVLSGGGIVYSYPASLRIYELHGASVDPADPLVNVPSSDADFLADMTSDASGASDGWVWTADGAGGADFEAAAAAGGYTRYESPPSTSNWTKGGYPDTTGDGTGTRMQSVATSATVYKMNFAGNNQFNSAPAGATAVVLRVERVYSSGLGNAGGLYLAPKEPIDGGMTLATGANLHFYEAAVVANNTDMITVNLGASQEIYFSTAGLPSGGTITVFVWIAGYLS